MLNIPLPPSLPDLRASSMAIKARRYVLVDLINRYRSLGRSFIRCRSLHFYRSAQAAADATVTDMTDRLI